MDAEILVGVSESGASSPLDVGQPSRCRSGVSQVRYVHFPRMSEGTLQPADTAGTFDQKGGRQDVNLIWDRATALYVRVMNVLDEPRGQGLVEYALIIGVVAVMLAGALYGFRMALITSFGNSSAQMANLNGN